MSNMSFKWSVSVQKKRGLILTSSAFHLKISAPLGVDSCQRNLNRNKLCNRWMHKEAIPEEDCVEFLIKSFIIVTAMTGCGGLFGAMLQCACAYVWRTL